MKKILLLLVGFSMFQAVLAQNIAADTILANAYVDTAKVWYDSAKYELSISYFEKAAKLYEKCEVWGRMLDCWNGMSENYWKIGTFDKALSLAQTTLSKSQELLGRETKQEGGAYNIIGIVHGIRGQNNQALTYFQKALAIRLAIHGKYHSEVAASYRGIGNVFLNQGQHNQALEYLQKVLAIYLKLYDKQHADIASSCYNIANVYNYQGKYKQALKYYQKALDIWTTVYGKQHLNIAYTYSGIGAVHMSQGQYEKALANFQNALAIQTDVYGNWHSKIAESYYNIANAYTYQGKYKRALTYSQKALNIWITIFGGQHTSTADAYDHIGSIYIIQGEYEKALEYCQKALDTRLKIYSEQHFTIAHSYNNVGIVYSDQGQYEQALEYYQKALVIYLAIYGDKHPKVAASYNNIGNIYSYQGQYEQALEYEQKALATRLAIYGDKHPEVAVSYSNIGLIYEHQEQYEQALEYDQKALATRLAIYGNKHPEVAASYSNIGNVYSRHNRYNQALKYHQEALAIFLLFFDEYHPHTALSYANIGTIYFNQRKYHQALEYEQKALTVWLDVFGKQHPYIVMCYNHLSATCLYQGEYEQALFFYQKALSANGIRALCLQNKLPTLDSIVNPLELLRTLQYRGETLHRKYGGTHVNQHLQNAHSQSILADRLIDSLRQYYQSPEDKIIFNQSAHDTYTTALQISNTAYKTTDNSDYIDTAFYYVEKSKVNLLHSALSESRALKFGNLPDSLIKQETALKSTITFYQQKIHELELTQDMAKQKLLPEYRDILFNRKQQYRDLLQNLETNYSDYYHLKYDTRVISIQEVQQKLLDDDAAFINYHFGNDSSIFVITITKDGKQLHELPRDTSLETQTQDLLGSLENPKKNVEGYASNAHAIYQSLLEPILDNLPKRLIISPDGILNYLPFDALLTELPKHERFNEYPYLINDYTISYTYSATLLDEMQNKTFKKQPKKQLLAFAPSFGEGVANDTTSSSTFSLLNMTNFIPSFLRSSVLKPLIHNIPEVKAISKYTRSKSFTKTEATKDAFLKNAPSYAWLHLSTHAKADDKNLGYSYIAFYDIPDSTKSDQYLTTGEIYNLPLNAELVTLSACETGIGDLKRGEGFLSLARAFAYAGVKSISTTLWSVDDRSTKEVIEGFYKYLKKGYGKDEALRQAKLDYINDVDGNNAHPFFWAAHIPIGDMSPLEMESNWWVYVLALSGGVLLLLVGRWWRKR